MGKITDRREKTAHTVIENKAVLAEGTKPKSEFPYKKLLIAVLVVVAIIACVLLVLNAFVDTYADKFATGESHKEAGATVTVTGDLYENRNQLMANADFRNAYLAASENHSKNYANIKSDPNVYNYVVTISSEKTDADSANISIIMLVSMNSAKEIVSYMAMNKSMLVEIPTVGVGPLYDAYAFGDAALLARTVQENFGVEIKGYVDMPLESFVQASIDVGGIKIDDQSLTDDEQNLNTSAKIYNYVSEASDRNAAMKTVIKSLAAKSSDAGVFGLKGVVDTISDSLDANIARDDFSNLLTMLVKAFSNEANVGQVGYISAQAITQNDVAALNGLVSVQYDMETALLKSAIYPTDAK